MQQPTRSDVRWEWISEGFNLYSAQWQNWIVLALIALVIFAVVVTPFYVLIFGAEFAAGDVLVPARRSGLDPVRDRHLRALPGSDDRVRRLRQGRLDRLPLRDPRRLPVHPGLP